MWLKQFLKGWAERVPEKVWVAVAGYFFPILNDSLKQKARSVENLNDAYTLGHDLAELMFGGDDERS